jgi:hypothetical protein
LPRVIKYLTGDDQDYIKLAIVVMREFLAKQVQHKDAGYINEHPIIINRLLEILGNIINDFNTMVY